MTAAQILTLGAGVTGLAAGLASRGPVFESENVAGGICASYYVRESDGIEVLHGSDNAYRFERGGGHWLFGGDPQTVHLIESISPMRGYKRRSIVYFPERELSIPYPLQNHLRFLPADVRCQALSEIEQTLDKRFEGATLAEWLEFVFGPTLVSHFFGPFHERYTAGLWTSIAPQDPYKSPADARLIRQGAYQGSEAVGYNVTFRYPAEGLDALASGFVDRASVIFGHKATHIDTRERVVYFDNGREERYGRLLSTLPLDKSLAISGLSVDDEPDPSVSVLVVNLGATRGPSCPSAHWAYVPHSRAGFHRVGFYSNVDPSFIPKARRESGSHVSLYVELARSAGDKPASDEIARIAALVIDELTAWGWIKSVDVMSSSWIETAYTWSRPGSRWQKNAMSELQSGGITPVGRYGTWTFQGIADSVRDGVLAGTAARAMSAQVA